jgi:hypothetical protein
MWRALPRKLVKERDLILSMQRLLAIRLGRSIAGKVKDNMTRRGVMCAFFYGNKYD